MNDIDKLQDWVETLNPRVQRNVKTVGPEDVGQDYFLHISADTTIRKFVPLIGFRQAPIEDRTVPRLTVAPTLLGCILGYSATEHDFLFSNADGKPDSNGFVWKGGYKIYEVPFKAALKPTGQLVYDSRNSDEHWLVPYSKETQEYIPATAGKMFFQSITFHGRSGKNTEGECVIYVEITKNEGVRFSKRLFLDKGYWRIEGPIDRNTYSWIADQEFSAKKVDAGEYKAAKVRTADLLALSDKLPSYLSW